MDKIIELNAQMKEIIEHPEKFDKMIKEMPAMESSITVTMQYGEFIAICACMIKLSKTEQRNPLFTIASSGILSNATPLQLICAQTMASE